ncbi:MAG: GNAT family protein [Parvibaculum sp.]|nr:GNAT family protein [Parvibaculum sp.]|tara:strand:+ start:7542 stop:8117 length:576 start_codon:yes stop_codon:yes gene_type:complete
MNLRGRPATTPQIELPLETQRLILREFKKSDLKAVHAYSSLEDVARYLVWGPNTLNQSKEAIEGFLDDQRARPREIFDVAITLKPKREVVGGVGIRVIDRDNLTGELGYTLHPDFWGYGIATEASYAMLDAGFSMLGLQRIVAHCDQRNKASARVMERLGMRREGAFRASKHIQGEWRDEFLYAMLAEDFS